MPDQITEKFLKEGNAYSFIFAKFALFRVMYIMKVKGTARIPDYVQIRDDGFTLIAYFRADRPEKELARLGLKNMETKFKKKIEEIPYGKLTHIEF